jgi:hypothetical protein
VDNWIFLLLGLILGIPLSILANIATPWATSTITKSVFSSKRKRIEALLREYRLIKSYREDRTLLITEMLKQLTARIMAIFVSASLVAFLLCLFCYSWLALALP